MGAHGIGVRAVPARENQEIALPRWRLARRLAVSRIDPGHGTGVCKLAFAFRPLSGQHKRVESSRSSGSRWSLWSKGSFLSIASKGSVLSVGSVGSAFCIGSVGSFLSVFSIGSAYSAFAVLSARSRWAAMAYRSVRSVLSSPAQEAKAAHNSEPLTKEHPVRTGAMSKGALLGSSKSL